MEEEVKLPPPPEELPPPQGDPNDPFYTGEFTSPKLRRGPLDKREITNMYCLIAFFIFWIFLWGAAYTSYRGFYDQKPQQNITSSYGKEVCGILLKDF